MTRAKLFPEAGREENSPDPIALASFMLILSWFVVAGAFILQEYITGSFVTGSGWANLFFLLSAIINCSLLIKSRNSFLFAGAGIGTLGLLYMLRHIHAVLVENYELIWHLAGGAGEQILLVLGLVLAFLSVSALMFLSLWFQAGEKKSWARKALLSIQVTFLTISLLIMLKPGGLAATPGGMTLALAVVTLLMVPVMFAVAMCYTPGHDELSKRKVYWAASTAQIIAAIGAVYYYAVSPGLQHYG